MSKVLVQRDRRSLFVRAEGYIARPVYPVGFCHVYPDFTIFKEDAKVTVRLRLDNTQVIVRRGAIYETWIVHGSANIGGGLARKTEDVWKPRYHRWPDTDTHLKAAE
jgi:hypothetical protein